MRNTLELMRERYYEFLTGNRNADRTDQDVRVKIAELEGDAEKYLNEMIPVDSALTGLWSDLPLVKDEAQFCGTYNMTITCLRLGVLALSYSTIGSSHKGSPSLGETVISGLEWMSKNIYCENSERWGNWWDWEIGSPLELIKCLTLMYDELPRDLLERYIKALEFHVPEKDTVVPGNANDIWNMFENLAIGMLSGDAVKVSKVMKLLDREWFCYTESDDGFYRDGSYVMHKRHPYAGSYGVSALEQLSKIMYISGGTEYELSASSKSVAAAWIKEAFAPFIYKGLMMDMVRGRAFSRELEGDHLIGHVAIRCIHLVSLSLPPKDAEELQSLVKYWAGEDSYRSIYEGANTVNNNNSVFFISLLKKLLADPRIAPSPLPAGHYRFYNMDRVVHLRDGYCAGISMYSDRIASFESGVTDDNLKGWYTGSGLLFLYNDDLGQFSGSFWPTVDSYRLPGTTVIKGAVNAGRAPNGGGWTGGCGLGPYGICGMRFQPEGQRLTAQKSWFMFDREIVALGSGITAVHENNVETIIENRKLSPGGENRLIVNAGGSSDAGGHGLRRFGGVDWIHLDASDIGFYFPGKPELDILRERRTGSWSEINSKALSSSDLQAEHEAHYVTITIDHGINPVSSSYAYVLLPGMSPSKVSEYAASPGVTVLENSDSAHAVRENLLNITGVNFWRDALYTSGFITCDRKASIMVRENKETIEAAISDPAWADEGEMKIKLDIAANRILSKDEELTAVLSGPAISLSLNLKGLKGKAAKIVFAK